MKIWIVSFTEKGAVVGTALENGLNAQGDEAAAWVRTSRSENVKEGRVLKEKLSDWTKEAFSTADAVIFIGAAGIAVRSIAPFVRDKYLDPAVVVVDELGRYCISLLSGHIGGANDLARRVAALIDAQPVITTATDLENRFAVDLFASANGLTAVPQKLMKDIAAAAVAGERVGFVSDYPTEGTVPEEIEIVEAGAGEEPEIIPDNLPEIGVCISSFTSRKPFHRTLHLIPRAVWLGIGCKKDASEAQIRRAAEAFLAENGIAKEAVAGVASCDVKSEEAGLKAFAGRWELPLRFFSAEELSEVEGDFASSDFVRQAVGVDNVCERASAAASGGGKLIAPKTVIDGVTVAAATEFITVKF